MRAYAVQILRGARQSASLAAVLLSLSPAVNAAEPVRAQPMGADTARTDTQFAVGDRFIFRYMDLFSGVEGGRHRLHVTALSADEVIFNNGRYITDRLGNDIKSGKGVATAGMQIFIPEYVVGKKWSTEFRTRKENGEETLFNYDFSVVAKERITVPAGTFDTYRVEGGGYVRLMRGNRRHKSDHVAIFKIWIAPDQVFKYVAEDYILKGTALGVGYSKILRYELVGFHRAGQGDAGDYGQANDEQPEFPDHSNYEEVPERSDGG
jgi:hypothetical protein